MSRRRVAYYYDRDVGSYTYGLGHTMKPHRIKITHDLVSAYDMTSKMDVIRPTRSSPEAMTAFHTDEYIHFLNRVTPETAEELTYQGTRFLHLDDNPPFEGVFEFCSISAGGSIAAAQRINAGAVDIAINWAGGLHHAKKSEASGFCYINDIVLGILELLRTFPRVLYIDIDCHHGDGVEEAFYTTDRVMTCSFHKYGDYFPGTGTQKDIGRGKGKGYSVNVPLNDGISDESFKGIFEPVITKILDVYQPSAVVLQCGADSLSGDKLGCFNLSMQGHAHCVQFFRAKNIPLILLGGGGYTIKNVARAWTFETACALGIENEIDLQMPWNEYFEWFGPRYRLEVPETNMEDLNERDNYLDAVRTQALQQLSDLIPAPSVGMHDVPRESVGEHLGFTNEEAPDKLDRSLAQHTRYLYDLQRLAPSHHPDPASDTSSSDDEGDADDARSTFSHPSSRRRNTAHHIHNAASSDTRKSIMSILTNQYHTLPSSLSSHTDAFIATNVPDFGFAGMSGSKKGKRRFFESRAVWDADRRRVVVRADESESDVEEGFDERGLGGSLLFGVSKRAGRSAFEEDVDMDVNDFEDEEGIVVE